MGRDGVPAIIKILITLIIVNADRKTRGNYSGGEAMQAKGAF